MSQRETTAWARLERPSEERLSQLLEALPPVSPPAELRAAISRRLAGAAPVAPLTCEQAQPLVSARLDGERIPEPEALEAHLANCVTCSRFAAALEDQRELLRHLPLVLPPDGLKERILSQLAGYQQSLLLLILTGLRRSRTAAWAAGAVACALVFAGLGYRAQQGQLVGRQPVPAAHTPRAAHFTPSHARAVPTGVRVAAESARPTPAASPSELSPPKRNSRRVVVRSHVRVAARPRPSVRETSAPTTPPASNLTTGPAAKTSAAPTSTATIPPTEPVSAPAVESSLHSPPTTDNHEASTPVVAETETAEGAVSGADDMAVAATEPSPPAAESDVSHASTGPVAPTYVDDSPQHAPGVDAVAVAPPVSTPAAPAAVDGVRFEAPPVKTQIARKPAPPAAPTAGSSPPTLAQIRDRLRRRRNVPPPVFPTDDEISRTARLTVWHSGF